MGRREEQHAQSPGYPLIHHLAPAGCAYTQDNVLVSHQAMYSSAAPHSVDSSAASSMLQQLQMSGSHLPLLHCIMQRELQSLTPTSPQLQLAQCVQQQRAAVLMQPPMQQQQGQQKRIEVVPLLGMSLMHMLSSGSAPDSLQDMPPADAIEPAELFAAMLRHSPFLNALHSELTSLRKVSGSCYTQIKQHLASVGQYLPPAADDSGRRSSTGSNDVPGAAPVEGTNSSSTRYYGRGLDLQQLHQQADAGALDLIHLEDCISSNMTNLAKLAQQYDIMITAALAAAAEHADAAAECTQQQGIAAADALARAANRKGSFLGPLFDAMRGKQAGSKGARGAGQQADAIEYVFMRPGVCSHSNHAQTHSFTAGVPPDVYSTCIHKLLSHSDCAERVLWMLSVIYARLRFAADEAAAVTAASGAHGNAGGAKQWRAPDKFTRKTTKYWVHPSNILRLKLALTKQLPLLVYGADDPVSSGDIAAVAAQEPGTKMCSLDQQQHKVTSLVSSVYFDNPDLDVYHTRLARLDGAKLVRVRYYGQRLTGDACDEQAMFVEQKTHREKDVGETSFKERASLKQSQLSAFLSGQVPLEQLLGPGSKKLELMGQIQDFMTDTRQAPVMRTEYLRSAWQAYDDNAVRFSFDENMLLLREGAATRNGSSDWCSPLESLAQRPASDAVRFPYAILEVKLQDRKASPAWVHELKTSGVLVEVPKFSKFLHGVALLQPEQIRELPSWFVWREGAGVTLPASLDEMWDMTAERRAQQEMDWQERLDAHDPAALGATNTPEVAAMLVLLKAPRVYAGTSALTDGTLPDLAAAAADAASKPPLVAAHSYDLTATAAAAQMAQPQAAQPAVSGLLPAAETDLRSAQLPGGLHSYPCHAANSNLATTSSNSANSSNSSRERALQGPAHSIMQDGQFGCAGDVKGSVVSRGGSAAGYQGPGGCMQPQLGLMVLPGRKDSFSCRRVPGTGLADVADSPTADHPEDVKGGSPPFAAHPLSVRVTMLPHRSLSSSSSMGSSDLHATNSSSSMGSAEAYAALPHFITCSSSPSCSSRSPNHPGPLSTLDHADSAAGYPRVHLAHEEAQAHRRSQQGTARGVATGRPHSRGSSSGATCDSWKLSTVNPMSAAGPLARSSTTAAPAGPAGAGMGGDTTYRAADSTLKASLLGPEGSQLQKGGYGGFDQDGAPLAPVRGDNVVLEFSKLAAQATAPTAALPAAAAAGRQQVIQVHYTGGMETVSVPGRPSPTPSPHRVRELSQLLPPVPTTTGGGAAADAAEAGATDQQVVIGVAADSAAKDVGRKGGRGYKQRMQQWKAAVGGRMKGLRGSRRSSGGMAAPFSLTSSSSANEHMLGFSGTASRQPTYVKPRADPKTFFANERTFLQWLQISVLVMMTGLGMLTGSSIALSVGSGGGGSGGNCMDNLICSASRISGAVIAPVSILFMVYALYLYQKRTNQLLTRSTLRYDDAHGPWLLTTLLIVVTIVVIVLALEAFKVSLNG